MKRSTISGSQEETEQNEDNEHKRRRLSNSEGTSKSSSFVSEKEETDDAHLKCETDLSEVQTRDSFSPELSSAPPLNSNGSENFSSFESTCSSNSISLNCSDSSSYNLSYNFPEEYSLTCEDSPSQNFGEVAAVHKNLSRNDGVPIVNSKPDAETMTTSLLRVKVLEGHSDDILCVAADESVIVSASADTTIKVWNMTEGKETCNFRGHTSSVTCIILLTAEQTEVLVKRLSLKEISGVVISGSLDCTLRLWSLPKGEEISSVYTFNGITCLQYLHHECCAIIGTDGGKLELWDLSCSSLLCSLHGHEDSVSDIYDDGCNICTTSNDGAVKVWQVKDHSLHILYSRKRKEVRENTNDLVPCQWKTVRSSQHLLYLGDNSTKLKILDWRTGKLKIQENQMWNSGTTDALCLYSNILVSSSFNIEENTGATHVWQLPEMKYICSMSGPVQRIYSLVITHTEDGMLRIVSAGSHLVVWDYDFSQPHIGKGDSSFKCHILEPLTTGNCCDKKIQSLDAKIRTALLPMNIFKRSWWCNVI